MNLKSPVKHNISHATIIRKVTAIEFYRFALGCTLRSVATFLRSAKKPDPIDHCIQICLLVVVSKIVIPFNNYLRGLLKTLFDVLCFSILTAPGGGTSGQINSFRKLVIVWLKSAIR